MGSVRVPKTTTKEKCIHYEGIVLPRCCSQAHTKETCTLNGRPCDPRRKWCEYEKKSEED